MSDRVVTVFGGTGFLGRRVVRQLRRRGFGVRVASRHADRSQPLFDDLQLRLIKADIHDGRSVAEALADAYLESAEAARDPAGLDSLQKLAERAIARLAWLRTLTKNP